MVLSWLIDLSFSTFWKCCLGQTPLHHCQTMNKKDFSFYSSLWQPFSFTNDGWTCQTRPHVYLLTTKVCVSFISKLSSFFSGWQKGMFRLQKGHKSDYIVHMRLRSGFFLWQGEQHKSLNISFFFSFTCRPKSESDFFFPCEFHVSLDECVSPLCTGWELLCEYQHGRQLQWK